MIRLRLLVLLTGAVVLAATPALACVLPGAVADRPTPLADQQAHARRLLALAAHAATTLTWSGTQYVGSWRAGTQTAAVLEVSHRPGVGSTVSSAPQGAPAAGDPASVVTPDLDERLLTLLAEHYALAVADDAQCAGRPVHVVEARRRDVAGPGSVAGRFWLDEASGLVLRREVYDEAGMRLRSSAFVDITVTPPAVGDHDDLVGADRPDRGDPTAGLPDRGWDPPRTLPDGLELFDAQLRDVAGGQVLHLAYSDGLTTLSLFAQRGSLRDRTWTGFRPERLDGTAAWVQPSAPERVVWQGQGQVFTVVSDADPTTVRAAVGALPRDPAPRQGLLARLERGLDRLGSWLNPFG